MNYQYYYNNAKSKYYNACSEINVCSNRINELKGQEIQEVNQINQISIDIKRNIEALEELQKILVSDATLNQRLTKVNQNINEAAVNYRKMVSSSNIVTKDLNSIYNDYNTTYMLSSILENLKLRKNIIESRIEELQRNLQQANACLQEIRNAIRITESNLQSWQRVKTNASIDMEYYKKKMDQSL